MDDQSPPSPQPQPPPQSDPSQSSAGGSTGSDFAPLPPPPGFADAAQPPPPTPAEVSRIAEDGYTAAAMVGAELAATAAQLMGSPLTAEERADIQAATLPVARKRNIQVADGEEITLGIVLARVFGPRIMAQLATAEPEPEPEPRPKRSTPTTESPRDTLGDRPQGVRQDNRPTAPSLAMFG